MCPSALLTTPVHLGHSAITTFRHVTHGEGLVTVAGAEVAGGSPRRIFGVSDVPTDGPGT